MATTTTSGREKTQQMQQYWHKTTLKTQSTASNNIKRGYMARQRERVRDSGERKAEK